MDLEIEYVDDFLHDYEDPLVYFRKETKRVTKEARQRDVIHTFSPDLHVSLNGIFVKAEAMHLEKANCGYN